MKARPWARAAGSLATPASADPSACRGWVGLEGAASSGGSVPHARYAEAFGPSASGGSAVVEYLDVQRPVDIHPEDRGGRIGVPGDVGQRLRRDLKCPVLHLRAQRRHGLREFRGHNQCPAVQAASEAADFPGERVQQAEPFQAART